MTPYEGAADPDKMRAIEDLSPGQVALWGGATEGVCCFGELLALGMKVRGWVGAVSRTVTVNPGDFVLGDSDGVAVVPKEMVLAILSDAEKITERENAIRKEIDGGASVDVVLKRYRSSMVPSFQRRHREAKCRT